MEWLGVYLEPVHLPAAHVVVHRPSEDVHGVVDHGCSMKQPATRHLRTQQNGGLPSVNKTKGGSCHTVGIHQYHNNSKQTNVHNTGPKSVL